MTPYERVQQSRALTAATFPLPSVLDCIRYAITELAEYDDALLRAERTGDKRNNDRQHDPRTELGQALYMLLSAAVQVGCKPWYRGDVINLAPSTTRYAYTRSLRALADIYDDMAMVDAHQIVLSETVFDIPLAHLALLAMRHGWPVDALIDDTCAAFERKHAPVEVR